MDTNMYLEKRDTFLMAQARHQLYEETIVFERGDMDLLYDVDGKEYIDCFSGIMVVNFGHCNREINRAIHEQLDRLQHVSTFFLTPQLVELAEKLSELTPDNLVRSFFVNSGSEAIDSAILLARAYTGNRLIMPVHHSYHGRTLLGTVCTNVAPTGQIDPRAQELDIHYVENAYCYRCPFGKQYPGCNIECAVSVKRSVEKILEESGQMGIAGILVEPIQGVGGVIVQPEEYLLELERIAHQFGGLLIVDEVQSGFARTGTPFQSNKMAVDPDIFCMAKGIANGLPLGAYSAKAEIGEAIKVPTFSTFGGNPLSSAAALAALKYTEEHDICSRTRVSGERFIHAFQEMAGRYEIIGDIRGEGLFIGLELVKDRQTKEPAKEETLRILDECRKRGLIIGKSGQKTNVIRIGPPLVITDEHIDRAVSILDEVFDLL